MHSSNKIAIFNDLIRINNNRLKGYSKAIKPLRNDRANLRMLFAYDQQDTQNSIALSSEVKNLGGSDNKTNRISGKIYRKLCVNKLCDIHF